MVGAGEFLVVGTVRRPHGVKGEIVVAVETDRPEAVFRRGSVLRTGTPTGEPLEASITIEAARPHKGGMLLRTAEHGTLDDSVEALRGLSLMIPAEEAAPVAPDEVHYRDLLGMAVVAAGQMVGVVKDLVETGGPELLVVERKGRPDLMVPFVKELVPEIDRAARRVLIDPPEGLLDL